MVATGSKPCGLPMQTAGGRCEVFLPADSLDLRSCLVNHHSVCFIADCSHCCLTPTAHLSVGFLLHIYISTLLYKSHQRPCERVLPKVRDRYRVAAKRGVAALSRRLSAIYIGEDRPRFA